jgi:hypothetical protein
VELLLDTDFIIKMARYSLLAEFDVLMKEHGHAASPFRYLYEIKGKVRRAATDPARSEFGSHIALNTCRSFVADGLEMGSTESDFDVFNQLREIEGMHQGEAILVAYMLHKPGALMVTGDKKMIDGLRTPDGERFRPILKGRIVHLNRIIRTLAFSDKWDEVRDRICKNPTCDAALYNAMAPALSKPDAQEKLHKMTVEFERSSLGLLRSSI